MKKKVTLRWQGVLQYALPVALIQLIFTGKYSHMKTTKKILANVVSILIPLMVVSGSAYSWTGTVDVGDTVIGETVTPEILPNGNVRYEQHVYGTAKDSVLVGDGNGNSSANGGYQYIYGGGVAENTTVNNGGNQTIKGGTSTGTLVNEGGRVNLMAGSLIDSITFGFVTATGGIVDNITVNAGGRFDVYANDAIDKIIVNGATLANGSTAMVTGNAELNDWSIAGRVTVFENGVSVAPLFTHADIINGGTLALYAGGQITDSTVNGGILYVSNENSLAKNTILNAGIMNVGMNAKIESTTVNNGKLTVKVGGIANGTIINDGVMDNIGGREIDTIINGGSYYMFENILSETDNITVNEAGQAYIGKGAVNGANVNGVMFVGYNGHSSVLKGDVNIGSSGKLDVVYNGENNTGEASLNVNGDVFLTNNTPETDATFNFNNATLQGGNISFSHTDGGEFTRLNLASLDGSGTFWMNTDIANQDGDFLNVAGEANGSFGVYVADSGVSPVSADSLQIIQTGGGSAVFALANGGVVDLGTYQYNLVADHVGGWFLANYVAPEPEPEPPVEPEPPINPPVEPEPPVIMPLTITPSTAAVLAMSTVDQLIFQSETLAVRGRLDEIRFSHDTNVWGKVLGSRYNVNTSVGADYDMNVTGIVIGADISTEGRNSVITKGAFFNYTHADIDFSRGGDGGVDSYSVGAYANYQHDNGVYVDGILKANRFNNTVDARMTSGVSASGSYNTNGIGASIQGGKYFYYGNSYIAPYGAVSGLTTASSNYTLSNGMKANIGSERSFLGEAGVNIGHQFKSNSMLLRPYAKLALVTEFVNSNTVKVNDDNFVNDLSGTRNVYQAGINAQITPSLSISADANHITGTHVESKWTGNLGLAYSFK